MDELSPLPEKPGSVTVLGVLNVVLGSFWLLGGMCGTAAMPLSMMAGRGGTPEYPFGRQFMTLSAVQSCVGAIVGLFFLLGGIGLLQGKAWGRKMSIGAAITKLGIFAMMQGVSVVMGASMLRGGRVPGMEQFDMPKEFAGLVVVIVLVGMCFGLLLNIAYPATMLVFMFTSRVREYFAASEGEGPPVAGEGSGPEEIGC